MTDIATYRSAASDATEATETTDATTSAASSAASEQSTQESYQDPHTPYRVGGSLRERASRRSYTAKVAFAFAAIAIMTLIIEVGVLSFVWSDHFQNYTRENMQRLANATANSIAENYVSFQGDWYSGTLAAAAAASAVNEAVSIQVVNNQGVVLYDDTARNLMDQPFQTRPSAQNSASAPIMVGSDQIGTVYIRVYGSNTLLTQADEAFRAESYSAVLYASIPAIIIAIVVGFFFARALVRPINKIADAANEIKEGNYQARAQVEGTDEVARLGKTFDLMADSIEANRQLERRLVTDVAHELRTPLMAIQSTVEAMIDGVFEPDEERLETLNSEIRRLSRLVNGLLKLSRLENRSNPVELTKVDVSELLETIIATHEQYVEDAGLHLIFNHDPHVYVLGNKDMLRQATANLISNAVRYTPEGGTITVSVKKGDIMGQISVQDTGIGLTPEEAKMVFSRFWRADKGRARDSGGLGIGLSVVKEIVDRHNGWVHVEGKPNVGSTFTIYIPLYREPTSSHRYRKGSRAAVRSASRTGSWNAVRSTTRNTTRNKNT